jgi:CheY-like chemotaxis protein
MAHRKRIFEPFFTTKQESSGTGLGLAAVYGTVVQHNGAISVYSEVDLGTEFHLFFPLCDNSPTEELKSETAISGEGLVLIVDDEPVVRATARLMLERLGYETVEAENGQEGVELYRQHQDRIQLVLLDMIMPVMDGTECFNILRQINPKVRVIISSGFSRDADLNDLKQRGLCGFIRKPYNMTELSKIVSQTFTTDHQA